MCFEHFFKGGLNRIRQFGLTFRGDGREKQSVVLSSVFRKFVQIKTEVCFLKTLVWIVPLKGQERISSKGPSIRDIAIDIDLPRAEPHP